MLKEILKEELQKYGVDWSLEEFQKQIELAIMNNHKEYIISKITKNGLKIFHNKIKNILDKIEIDNKINIPESYLDNIIDDFILNDDDLIITHDNIEFTYGYIGNKKYILKVIDNKDNTYNFSVYSVE